MSPLLISVTVFFLLSAVAVSVYAALYGSHRTMQERFGETMLQLRTFGAAGNPGADMPDSVARPLLQWALRRMPAPKKTRATGGSRLPWCRPASAAPTQSGSSC